MRLPERDPYAPREWQPHEKPALLGSPSTPEHSTPKRIAYGVVGLLVCLTGALGNAVVTANLQNLQGTFGAWSTEISWLPAVASEPQIVQAHLKALRNAAAALELQLGRAGLPARGPLAAR